MPEVTIYATKSAFLSYEYPNLNQHGQAVFTFSNGDKCLIGFGNAPDNVKFKRISEASLHVYGICSENDRYGYMMSAYGNGEDFDQNAVTWNTKPVVTRSPVAFLYPTPASIQKRLDWASGKIRINERNVYRYGIEISYYAADEVYTEKSSYKPYITITYQEDTVTAEIKNRAPASGYIPKGKDNNIHVQFISLNNT